jgi:hypothetical protein
LKRKCKNFLSHYYKKMPKQSLNDNERIYTLLIARQ